MKLLKRLFKRRHLTARTSTSRLIDDLEVQRSILEKGFFCDTSPLQRMAAAGALGSMKVIISHLKENAQADNDFTGTQAEDLVELMKGRTNEKT